MFTSVSQSVWREHCVSFCYQDSHSAPNCAQQHVVLNHQWLSNGVMGRICILAMNEALINLSRLLWTFYLMIDRPHRVSWAAAVVCRCFWGCRVKHLPLFFPVNTDVYSATCRLWLHPAEFWLEVFTQYVLRVCCRCLTQTCAYPNIMHCTIWPRAHGIDLNQ